MEEKEIKTSVGQRVAIGIIAFLMLGSIIASYTAIIVGNSSSSSSSETGKLSDERMSYYQDKYAEKLAKFKEVSQGDFDKFSKYLSEVKAYNESSANEGGLKIRDIVNGTGRALGEKDSDYIAYYVGWCADESVFDSSLDSDKSPAAFVKAIDLSTTTLIEGWYQGIQGMKIGGIREITVPSDLAYKDQAEICGGYNKPLKFLIMSVPAEEPLKTATSEVNFANEMLYYATHYGMDYEKEAAAQATTK